MVAGKNVRLLFFRDALREPRVGLTVILQHVARLVVGVKRLEEKAVLRGDLLFELRGKIELGNVIVRPLSELIQVADVERVTGVVNLAEVRAVHGPIAAAEILGAGTDAEVVGFEQPRVLLLRNILRERAGADWFEQIRNEELAQPRCLVTQVDLLRIAQCVVAVGEKQVGRVIRVVAVDGPRRLAHAHVGHAGIAVNGREIGAAHGAILIEQQPRAKHTAVVV